MRFKVGDKVKLQDMAWSFGVQNGEYRNVARHFDTATVIRTGLRVLRSSDDEECDLLVEETGNFWFMHSGSLKPSTHTVQFDGGEKVTISDESYKSLKKALK